MEHSEPQWPQLNRLATGERDELRPRLPRSRRKEFGVGGRRAAVSVHVDSLDRKSGEDVREPTDVVRVRMGCKDRVKVADASRQETLRNKCAAPAAVDEQAVAVDGDKRRIALTDVDEEDFDRAEAPGTSSEPTAASWMRASSRVSMPSLEARRPSFRATERSDSALRSRCSFSAAP